MKTKCIMAGIIALASATASAASPAAATEQLPDSVYLMAYFTSPAQHLFYAWSTDGLNWQQANGGQPIFTAYDASIWMRAPYLNRITRNGKDTYHLVHTWGWDNPAIFHWQSDDLIHWTAADGGTTTDSGKIYVMDLRYFNGRLFRFMEAYEPEGGMDVLVLYNCIHFLEEFAYVE